MDGGPAELVHIIPPPPLSWTAGQPGALLGQEVVVLGFRSWPVWVGREGGCREPWGPTHHRSGKQPQAEAGKTLGARVLGYLSGQGLRMRDKWKILEQSSPPGQASVLPEMKIWDLRLELGRGGAGGRVERFRAKRQEVHIQMGGCKRRSTLKSGRSRREERTEVT